LVSTDTALSEKQSRSKHGSYQLTSWINGTVPTGVSFCPSQNKNMRNKQK
jgi:hypothetical protein